MYLYNNVEYDDREDLDYVSLAVSNQYEGMASDLLIKTYMYVYIGRQWHRP